MTNKMTKKELRAVWLENFARGISKKDAEKFVVSTGDHLWHIFSYELLDKGSFLTGDDAKRAYDRADKRKAMYIEWLEDDETRFLTAALDTADALDEMTESVIVASDLSWTYIKTHEGMCGPYFMRL